jgi:hypothetical protein
VEETLTRIVKAFIDSGPIGLLALVSIITNVFAFRWVGSVYATLGAIQERRVIERDAVVTALQSAANGLEDVAKLTPEVVEALRVLRDIKEIILPEQPPRKRR